MHGAIGGAVGGAVVTISVPTSDAAATPAAAASKLTELSEERAAILACPGVPFLATLKDLDEEDKTIVDDLILNDWKHRNDAGYCGYVNNARASARGIDWIVWVIERGFYPGALDVGLIVRTQTLDDSLRTIQALHERRINFPMGPPFRFEFPMDLPLRCAEKEYYSIVKWLFDNVEQFRANKDKVLELAIERKNVKAIKYLCTL